MSKHPHCDHCSNSVDCNILDIWKVLLILIVLYPTHLFVNSRVKHVNVCSVYPAAPEGHKSVFHFIFFWLWNYISDRIVGKIWGLKFKNKTRGV